MTTGFKVQILVDCNDGDEQIIQIRWCSLGASPRCRSVGGHIIIAVHCELSGVEPFLEIRNQVVNRDGVDDPHIPRSGHNARAFHPAKQVAIVNGDISHGDCGAGNIIVHPSATQVIEDRVPALPTCGCTTELHSIALILCISIVSDDLVNQSVIGFDAERLAAYT